MRIGRKSIPGCLAQLVRASPLQGEGLGFESLSTHHFFPATFDLRILLAWHYAETALLGETACKKNLSFESKVAADFRAAAWPLLEAQTRSQSASWLRF